MRLALRLSTQLLLLLAALWFALAAGLAARSWWRLPSLSAWHQVVLPEEYRARDAAKVPDFAAYLALENRLFGALRTSFYANPAHASTVAYGRYTPGSKVAVRALDGNGNRSSVRLHPQARGVAVLLHGLSDSPYSLHAVSDVFYARSVSVISVRLPGHGTVPAALLGTSWEDWYGVVELALNEAARIADGQPVYLVGYSTGAPLALLNALDAARDPSRPQLTRLILISPALAVSDVAFLSNFAANLAFLPGLERARWLDVYPETDPYKYGSFPIRAGEEAWRITRTVAARMDAAVASGEINRMAGVSVFQSLVDATVQPRAVIDRLLLKLPKRGVIDELVVFDLNRSERFSALIDPVFARQAEEMAASGPFDFQVALISNRDPNSNEVVEYLRAAGSRETQTLALGLHWPGALLSLSHIALPFPVDDPMYGLTPTLPADGFTLGGPALRGETGALALPLGRFARVRSNPFFSVIEGRIEALLQPAPQS
jgi:alpha-beta hydrolase superfamily lysophospholipase